MKLKLYNTLNRKVEEFTSLNDGKANLYACGPTVYARAHLGNMRTYIFVDLLCRVLRLAGYDVQHVMNITDVGHLSSDADEGDDKLEIGAARESKTAWELAEKYESLFFEDAGKLNILTPSTICRATDHIGEQIEMIAALENQDFTYVADDGVYFDTSKFADYGKMAKLDIEGLNEGHRVQAGCKRNKTDFALWKFSPQDKKRDMEWESPWGLGFPGWHIECSAMARHYLGDIIDIHTGGTDHIPVHHTNEIAQSECATGQSPFVRFWMHGAFLVFGENEKISKSQGHECSVGGLETDGFEPLVYRLLCLTAHYRNFLKYDVGELGAIATSLERLRAQCRDLGYEKPARMDETREAMAKLEQLCPKIQEALFNDLNMPEALVAFRRFLKDEEARDQDKRTVITAMDYLTGLDLYKNPVPTEADLPQDVIELVNKRDRARKDKNWQESDALRDSLMSLGYSVKDGPDGTQISKKS